MPELDTAGKLAIRLQECDEEIGEAWKSRQGLEEQLCDALEATGRDRIKVGDTLFLMRTVKAHSKISIKKDTKKKALNA